MNLVLNTPVVTTVPELSVDGLAAPGVYHFQLTVTDTSGNTSRPALCQVTMLPRIIIKLPVDPVVNPIDPVDHPVRAIS